MSTETTFKCDICRQVIKDEAFMDSKNKAEAFALKWTTNNTLVTNCPWRDAPLHICDSCVKAIVDFDASRTK